VLTNPGVLYIVATPIGNRDDISQRALAVLSEVDFIAAEDTRHSGRLLQYFNIKTRMQAYHDHNEEHATPQLIEKLQAGQSIALISDAGTPLLSDPGYRLVKAAHEANIKVCPIAGACAAVAALSASGLPTDRFTFVGFPPVKSVARCGFYAQLLEASGTQIFYESSHRIQASLADMLTVFGAQRPVVLAREISKTFETIKSAPLGELVEWLNADANQRKGEFVVLLQGFAGEGQDEIKLKLVPMLKILLDELPVKQAAQLAAKITGQKKNAVYKLALELNNSQ